jgi:hypothetical protein
MHGDVAVEEVDSAGSPSVGIHASIARELIESWCITELRWVPYERYNAPPLWDKIMRHLSGNLGTLWVTGTLQGDHLRDAFRLRCGETMMTPDYIDHGQVVCLIEVAPVIPRKFVAFRIRIRLNPR